MKIVYVAGPFRAESDEVIEMNIQRAEAVTLDLLRMGASVICPHSMTGRLRGALPDEVDIK